jgi:FKBP-type peptidyl-prolyl cis-trans isomerase SlpA
MSRLRLLLAMARIAPDSHVTLHYRLAALVEGVEREVISTLDGRPATLQLGGGHLAVGLEARLHGLEEGAEATFELAPAEAFGDRNPDLVQSLTRAAFDTNAGADGGYAAGDVVEFNDPRGGRLAGVLKESGDRRVVVDFNHPLAGLAVRFTVRVIGVI